MAIHKRKWAPTNMPSEAYNENELQSIEFFNACRDRNRQAPGDEMPMPWPFFVGAGSSQGRSIAARVEGNVRNVLRENNIQVGISGFQVFSLYRKGLVGDAIETLVINTTDDQSESIGLSPWWYAACAIQELLDKEIQQSEYPGNIRVEIRNQKLMDQNISAAVPADSEAFELLTRMREDVIKEVRQRCLGVGPISFVMRGSRDGEKYPTVLVGIKPGTVSNWTYSYNCIVDVIERFSPSGVDLEFIPEIIQPFASIECRKVQPKVFKRIRDLPATACNGSSIGPRGTAEAGSLGVWVWLKEPGRARKMAFLTCYHVIRTGQLDNQMRRDNDKNGIGLDGRAASSKIIVDYPAPFDSAPTESFLTTEIGQGRHGDNQSLMDRIHKYRTYPGIGEVAYASGHKKKNKAGKSMDWAIVVLPFSGPNPGQNLPPPDLLPMAQTNGEANFDYDVRPNEIISVVGEPLDGGWALKKGRTTGITTGTFNGIKTNMLWEYDNGVQEMTDEYVMLSFWGQILAMGGDTGSMIMNQKKEWVGMLTAISTSNDAVYFTCAQDIIDDVKDRTGCEISLPK